MKRFTAYLVLFLLTLFVLSNSIYASPHKRLEITSALIDLDDRTMQIFGNNFGYNPNVTLGGFPLVVLESTNEFIEAELWEGIEPGTYRLIVASRKFLVSNRISGIPQPWKIDKMDVTICAKGSESRDTEPPTIESDAPLAYVADEVFPITVTIRDNKEIGYYAYEPHGVKWLAVDPGITELSETRNFRTKAGEVLKILVLACDVSGNCSKLLIEVEGIP